MKTTEPVDIDYTQMKLGQRVKLPQRWSRIVLCPKCNRHGLLLVCAWRKGRYEVDIYHLATKDLARFLPNPHDACRFKATRKIHVPKALVVEVDK